MLFFLSYLLVMMSIFSIGLVIGGTAPDLKSAGIIASILYFPMMIFSGATLPYEIMPLPLQRVSDILPLTQAIKLLKSASLGIPLESAAPVIYLIILFICCSAAAANLFKWE